MDLSNLKPVEGTTHSKKRIGRGQGSGRGGPSTRGQKGAHSRSGQSRKNINRTEYKGINISALQALAEKNSLTKIDVETLIAAGLARKNSLVKILGNGNLTMKLEVTAHAFSEAAVKAIEAQEGTVVKL